MKSIRKIIFVLFLIAILLGNVELYATTLTEITPIASFEGGSAGDELNQENMNNLIILDSGYTTSVPDDVDGIILNDGSQTDVDSIMEFIKDTSTDSGENTDIAAEEEILNDSVCDSDFYSFDVDNVVIDKNVNGNIYIIAKEVTINQNISGNVFIIAEKITHNACIISGSIYEMAEEIYFTDSIPNTETIDSNENNENTANEISNERYNGSVITGSVYAIAQDIFDVSGHISFYNDINLLASKFNFNSEVYRKLNVRAEEITIGTDAFISNKEDNYLGYTDSANDNTGRYEKYLKQVEKIEDRIDNIKDIYSPLKAKIAKYLTCIVTIIFIMIVASAYNLKYQSKDKSFVNKAGAIGTINLIIMPIVSILLICTVVGIPVGIVGLLVWLIIAMILAKPVLALYLTNFVLKDKESSFIRFLLAVVIYICLDLITMIPGVGIIASVVCSAWGFGIVVSVILDKKIKKNKEKKQIEEIKTDSTEEEKNEEVKLEDENNNEIKESND